MNLGKLIDRLHQEDPNRQVPIGFCNPHSHRGDYSELAFEVELETTVSSMLSAAKCAVNRDLEGYKGGTYRMTLETECCLTKDDSMSGIKIDDSLLDRILSHNLQVFSEINEIDCVCKNCKPVKTMTDKEEYEVTNDEQAGYVLAMRLLQSDLGLDDLEMSAIAQFTQPEVIRRVLRAMK